MFSRKSNLLDFGVLLLNLEKKYPDIFFTPLKVTLKNKKYSENCGAGWQHLVISPKGQIRSCVMLGKDTEFGNIFTQNIIDICRSGKVRFYKSFLKKENEKDCEECTYNNYCGSCIARIYTANIQRIGNGLALCEIVKKNKMDEHFDFHSNFKFKI